METDFCGPSLPPQFCQSVQSNHGSRHSDLHSEHLDSESEHSEQPQRVCSTKAKKHLDKKKHKVWAKYYSVFIFSPLFQAPSEQDQQQDNPDPVFNREVDISDLPSQYTEEVETFRHILDLPDPRETMPRSSITVLGLDDEKGQQKHRPRGPSAMLPLSPYLKDAFAKFEQDFLAYNLP